MNSYWVCLPERGSGMKTGLSTSRAVPRLSHAESRMSKKDTNHWQQCSEILNGRDTEEVPAWLCSDVLRFMSCAEVRRTWCRVSSGARAAAMSYLRQATLTESSTTVRYNDGHTTVLDAKTNTIYDGFTKSGLLHGEGVRWYPRSLQHCVAYTDGVWRKGRFSHGKISLANGDLLTVMHVARNYKRATETLTVTYKHHGTFVEGVIRRSLDETKSRLYEWTYISNTLPETFSLSVHIDGWGGRMGVVPNIRPTTTLHQLRCKLYQLGVPLPLTYAFKVYRPSSRYSEPYITVGQCLPLNSCQFFTSRLRCQNCTNLGWWRHTDIHNNSVLAIVAVPVGQQDLLDCYEAAASLAREDKADELANLLRCSQKTAAASVMADLDKLRYNDEEQEADRLRAEPVKAPFRRGAGSRLTAAAYKRSAKGPGYVSFSPCTPSPLGVTLLHEAASKGGASAIGVLLKCGADPSAQDSAGQTPLHVAAAKGFSRCVALLVGKEVDTQDAKGNTALHNALRNKHLNTALWLVEQGASVDITNNSNTAPYELALRLLPSVSELARAGDYRMIHELLAAAGGCKSQRGVEYLPWLGNHRDLGLGTVSESIVYLRYLQLKLTKNALLLDLTACMTWSCGRIVSNIVMRTALHEAAEAGHAEVVEVLASCCLVELESKDTSGCTALHLAARRGHVSCIKALIFYGAKITARESHNRLPLHLAVSKGRAEAAALLIRGHHESEGLAYADSSGITPVHECIARGTAFSQALLPSLLQLPNYPDVCSIEPTPLETSVKDREQVGSFFCVSGDLKFTNCAPALKMLCEAEEGHEHLPFLQHMRDMLVLTKTQTVYNPSSYVVAAVRYGNVWALRCMLENGWWLPTHAPLLELAYRNDRLEMFRELQRRGMSLGIATHVVMPNGLVFTCSLGVAIAVRTEDSKWLEVVQSDVKTSLVASPHGGAQGVLAGLCQIHKHMWPMRWKGLNKYIRANLPDDNTGMQSTMSMTSIPAMSRILKVTQKYVTDKRTTPCLHADGSHFLSVIQAYVQHSDVSADELLAALPDAAHSKRLFESIIDALPKETDPQVVSYDTVSRFVLRTYKRKCPAYHLSHPVSVKQRYLENQLLVMLTRRLVVIGERDRTVHEMCAARCFTLVECVLAGGIVREWGRGTDWTWKSALHNAALHGTERVVCLLLKHNMFDVNSLSGEGLAPLHYAALGGDARIVHMLLKRHANPCITSTLYQKVRAAVGLSRYFSFTNYVDASGDHLDMTIDQKGVTPLHLMAWKGFLDMVMLLITRKVSIDAFDKNDATPLMYAARAGRSDVVSKLLDHGASALHADKDGNTAAMHAARCGHGSLVMLFVSRNQQSLESRNPFTGYTMLHSAAERGLMSVVRAYICLDKTWYSSALLLEESRNESKASPEDSFPTTGEHEDQIETNITLTSEQPEPAITEVALLLRAATVLNREPSSFGQRFKYLQCLGVQLLLPEADALSEVRKEPVALSGYYEGCLSFFDSAHDAQYQGLCVLQGSMQPYLGERTWEIDSNEEEICIDTGCSVPDDCLFEGLFSVCNDSGRISEMHGDENMFPALQLCCSVFDNRGFPLQNHSPMQTSNDLLKDAPHPYNPLRLAVAMGHSAVSCILRPIYSNDKSQTLPPEDKDSCDQWERTTKESTPVVWRSSLPEPSMAMQSLANALFAAEAPDTQEEEFKGTWNNQYYPTLRRVMSNLESHEWDTWDDVDAMSNRLYGSTCFYAARMGFLDLLSDKIHLVGSLDATNKRGVTVLMCAVWFSQEHVVSALLNKGCCVNKGTKLLPCEGGLTTCVSIASTKACPAMMKLLLSRGAVLDVPDENGNTVVHNVCRVGDFETLKVVLSYGAPVHHVNFMNETALQIVMALRVEDCSKLLKAWFLITTEKPSSDNCVGEYSLLSVLELKKWYHRAALYYKRIDMMPISTRSPMKNASDSIPCLVYTKLCDDSGCRPLKCVLQQLKYHRWLEDVKELDLSSVHGDMEQVLGLIKFLHNLETIDLSSNRLEQHAVAELCARLKNHPSLRRVQLGNNRDIDSASGVKLLNLLKKNKNLVELQCANTAVGSPLQMLISRQCSSNIRAQAKSFSDASQAKTLHMHKLNKKKPKPTNPISRPVFKW